MAPTLGYNSNPWSWSSCSSAMLLRFLDHQRAQTQCLFDKPTERRYYEKMFETPSPGAVYTVSQQCKFVFGAAAEICPYMPTCRRLWCSVSYGYQMGCRTQHMPWADATPCGDNMWCHRGQCVGMSPMQRQPIGGAWGEWRPWRECSRTCGGGVQKAFRECDSPRPENGGKYCVGQRERYRPCNVQYSGIDQAVERINGTGPLRSDIYLHVLSVGNLNRPNIRYHFMTPISASAALAVTATAPATATATGASSFYWRTKNNWTECTLKCQGEQGEHVRCTRSFTNRPVAQAHCAGIQRPDMQKRMCNVYCFYKYLQWLNTDSAGRKCQPFVVVFQYICVRSYTNEKEEQALESECQPPPAAAVSVPSTELRQHQQQQQQQAQQQQQQQKLMAYSPSQHRWTALWAYSQWSQVLHCIDTRIL
uniref:ADAM_CR_2 domain-containing protein n=1 Tax=Globodera pallida TaxID=36090 RepID=A0A183CCD0_GLOPA